MALHHSIVCEGAAIRVRLEPTTSYEEFSAVLVDRFGVEEINSIVYCIRNDNTRYRIQNTLSLQDALQDELFDRIIINEIVEEDEDDIRNNENADNSGNNINNDAAVNNNNNEEELEVNQTCMNRSYRTAMAKLAILEIPYEFRGSPKENIHLFKRKVMAHCAINDINEENLFKLLLNGKIIRGSAWDFIQQYITGYRCGVAEIGI